MRYRIFLACLGIFGFAAFSEEAALDRVFLKNGAIFQGQWEPATSTLNLIGKDNKAGGRITIKTNNILKIEKFASTNAGASVSTQNLLLNDDDKLELGLREQIRKVEAARMNFNNAQNSRLQLHQTYGHRSFSGAAYEAIVKRYKDADDLAKSTAGALDAARAHFDELYKAYQSSGGKKSFKCP